MFLFYALLGVASLGLVCVSILELSVIFDIVLDYGDVSFFLVYFTNDVALTFWRCVGFFFCMRCMFLCIGGGGGGVVFYAPFLELVILYWVCHYDDSPHK